MISLDLLIFRKKTAYPCSVIIVDELVQLLSGNTEILRQAGDTHIFLRFTADQLAKQRDIVRCQCFFTSDAFMNHHHSSFNRHRNSLQPCEATVAE